MKERREMEDRGKYLERMEKYRRKKTQKRENFTNASPEEKIAFFPTGKEQETEFEIQSYLYSEIKNLGYLCRGELKTKCQSCRFDLIIFKEEKPIGIIEVKKNKLSKEKDHLSKSVKGKIKKQEQKYSQFGLPVKLIFGMKMAKQYINEIKEQIDNKHKEA